MRYRDAGVDIASADLLKSELGRLVRDTWSPAVRHLPGGFAGVMTWPGDVGGADSPPRMVAATMDGVGTKLHLALAAGRVGDAAADLVYHGADDLLVHGARPLAFLDYIAQGTLDPEVVLAVVRGLARACREVGAALLGGETAQMPDTYLPGVVDVAGCMIGSVSPDQCLDGRSIRSGDLVLGLASTGLHTNGYSLARRILDRSGLTLADPLPGMARETIGEALLHPHRWYGPALAPPIEAGRVRALAHVTGGGIAGNLVRVLPEGLRARIHASAWSRPPLFRWLIETGAVPEADARQTFNLGIGMIVVCKSGEALALTQDLVAAGETVHRIGEVVDGERDVEWVE